MLGEIDVALLFQTDSDLIEMRSYFPQVFFDVFNEGFKFFIKGDWKMAKKILKQIEFVKKVPDTPTILLLDFMGKTNFVAPADWKGYRMAED